MSFFKNLLKSPYTKWMENATDEELEEEYENERQKWIKDGMGDGLKTPEMKRLDEEMSKRSAEKWENDPRRNTDPNYRWSDKNRWDKD